MRNKGGKIPRQPEDQLVRNEELEEIQKIAGEKLGPKERSRVAMYFLGMSYPQIGKVEGVTRQRARGTVVTGCRKIKKALKERES